MRYSTDSLKYKHVFRYLYYYSMPLSILFIFRKRLNFVFGAIMWIVLFIWFIL